MKPITLFTAALLVGGPIALLASADAASGSASVTHSPVSTFMVQDGEYESLSAEYVKAEAEYSEKLKTATKDERKALRKSAPITTYWERFEALAQKGDGQSMLWLVDHIRDNRDIRSKSRGEALTPLFKGLFENHVNAEWFDGAIGALASNVKNVGSETAHGFFEAGLKAAKDDDRKASLLWFAASSLSEDMPAESKAYMARISEEFGNTVYGTAARAADAKAEDSEVGKVAPTFVGKTIDGFQFSLEDYRGKVVVLDFYGFW